MVINNKINCRIMNRDVECPYCQEGQEINHDDGYGYSEDLHQQQCWSCSKVFTFTTSIIYCYESYKADCLNGKGYDFKPSTTFPKQFTKMICTTCDEKRKPTEEEMKQILINQ